MMMKRNLLIKNGNIVNEGRIIKADVFICNDLIEDIGCPAATIGNDYETFDATGKYLLPGVIDAHVHFREPGLTHKADIYTESKAAVAGGVTSFFDMPNTLPNTLSVDEVEKKNRIAAQTSFLNYAFFLGVNQQNADEVVKKQTSGICGITDDGLYFSGMGNLLAEQPSTLKKIFQGFKDIVAIHSEKESLIEKNEHHYRQLFGDNIPVQYHPLIRSEEACVSATKDLIDMANLYGARLHILHVTTGAEAQLFRNDIPLNQKKITAEVSIPHLWFCDADYATLGTRIKCNPAVKTANDREQLLQALLDDRIDIITTDHAPHTAGEKDNSYFLAPSGIPIVQHSLIIMLELYRRGRISLEMIAEKMCHNPAILYGIKNRGFIRKGYKADLTIVDVHCSWKVSKENILHKCGWSPLEGQIFQSKVICTLVNGNIVFENDKGHGRPCGEQLEFDRVIDQ
jgi:dihydroorotase